MTSMRDAGVVERINAELAPLPERGASELVVSVEERRPWSIEARYDNHHAPAVGARRPSLWGEHRNVSGWGDKLDGHIGRTEGLEDFHVAYSAGFPRSPWRVGARFERSDSLAIDPPSFRDLEITTVADTRRLEVSRAFGAAAGQSISAALAGERRSAESTLLGLPFSFIPGIADGVTRIDVARLSSEFSALGKDAVLFLRGQWSEGRSRRDIERVELAVDARFRVIALQGQYARRLSDAGAQVLLRVDSQWTPDTLFPIEKKAVGGAESVRGYRENVWLRDRAVVGTVEGRWPLVRRDDGWGLTLAAFTDGAWARDTVSRLEQGPSTIASVGGGMAFTLPYGLSGRVDYARPNRRWLTDNADSQDRGLHFRVSWTY
jgi:hemolysin activation/secretion protein